LAAFFAFFAIGSSPPSGWVMRQVIAAPPAVASAAWHSARGCRLLLRLAARLTWARDAEKWGSLENRPG
jgi:hypothetical protein